MNVNLLIEHDRLEEFCMTYKGKLSLNYEIERLRELKQIIKNK